MGNTMKKSAAHRNKTCQGASRLAAAVLASVIMTAAVLSLTGCSGEGAASSGSTSSTADVAAAQPGALEPVQPDARELAQTVLTQSESVKSAAMDMNVRFSLSLSAAGEENQISSAVRSLVETTTDPFATHSVSSIETDPQEAAEDTEEAASPLTVETFGELTEDGRYAVYSKGTGEEAWSKYTVSMADASTDIFDKSLLGSIAAGETPASVSPDTDIVNGKTCYVMETALQGDLAKQSLDTAISTLSEMGMQVTDLPEDIFQDVEVAARLWIDADTGLYVKMTEDLTELGNALFNALFQTMMPAVTETAGDASTAAAQDVPEISFEFQEYAVEVLFTDYNSIDGITIPEEARAAQEVSAATGASAAEP